MTDEEVLDWCISVPAGTDILDIPEALYQVITKEQAASIQAYFGNNMLIKLPEKEVAFFEWLKKEDTKIWNDLWSEELNAPYIVSISFLTLLVYKDYRGFPICDLENNENYYFTADHMVDKESQIWIETSKKLFLERKPLTVPQLLSLEISLEPTDIWHFTYKHKLNLEAAKKAVDVLVEDKALVHLKDSAHLAPFIDF